MCGLRILGYCEHSRTTGAAWHWPRLSVRLSVRMSVDAVARARFLKLSLDLRVVVFSTRLITTSGDSVIGQSGPDFVGVSSLPVARTGEGTNFS